jgi:hypothetical protein
MMSRGGRGSYRRHQARIHDTAFGKEPLAVTCLDSCRPCRDCNATGAVDYEQIFGLDMVTAERVAACAHQSKETPKFIELESPPNRHIEEIAEYARNLPDVALCRESEQASAAEEYRANAVECERKAARVISLDARENYRIAAEVWREMAQMVERDGKLDDRLF